jgi:hypothetical protein
MKTFELMNLPPGRHTLKAGWVHIVKRDANGMPIRYKACLIVKGYAQRYSINYANVFAHILHTNSWRILIALAARLDWDVHQLDVVGAFLNGKVKEEIYMEQIPGYEDSTGRVLHLVGSLYGLKQAPRIWNKTLGSKLIACGYTCLKSKLLCFVRCCHDHLAILAIYVDNIAIFATRRYVEEVKAKLLGLFKMWDMGELGHFLGYRVTRDCKHKAITITQDNYTKMIIECTRLSNSNPTKVPMAAGTQLPHHEGACIDYPYSCHIGSVLYAALVTCPDIAYAVQHLSQFNSNPGPTHIAGIKTLFRYLKGMSALGITYNGNEEHEHPIGYSDTDWAQNILDRKSISSQVFIFASAAVSWVSKKQPVTAISSMEAEYLALSFSVRHALWPRMLFNELGFPSKVPTMILTDNLATIALAKDPQYHAWSKHIDIWHHFIWEQIELKTVEIQHVPSENNLANLLTKALVQPWFECPRDKVMGIDSG